MSETRNETVDATEKPEKVEHKNMNFSWALNVLKAGFKVTRAGWNGKGMFLMMAGGYSIPKTELREGTHITPEFLESRSVEELEILPHIDMWTADNKYLTGWLASQTDMLADDWMLAD